MINPKKNTKKSSIDDGIKKSFEIMVSWDQSGEINNENIINFGIVDQLFNHKLMNPYIINPLLKPNNCIFKTSIFSKHGSLLSNDVSLCFEFFKVEHKFVILNKTIINHVNASPFKIQDKQLLFLELKDKNFNELEFLNIEIINYERINENLKYSKQLNEFQDGNILFIGTLSMNPKNSDVIFEPVFLYYKSFKHFNQTYKKVNNFINKENNYKKPIAKNLKQKLKFLGYLLFVKKFYIGPVNKKLIKEV